MAEHFTAVIEVNRVTEAVPDVPDQYGKVRPGTPKVVQEVARLVLRAEDMDTLKDKIAKHVEFVDDF